MSNYNFNAEMDIFGTLAGFSDKLFQSLGKINEFRDKNEVT